MVFVHEAGFEMGSMKQYRKYLLLSLGFVFVVGGTFAGLAWRDKASGVTASDWIPGRIADDAIFFNPNTMNPGDIQNFLNAKVPTCDTNGTQPSGHNGYATRADWGNANGAPPPYTCLRHYTQGIPSVGADAYCNGIGGGTKSAADIIFNVAQACGVNPQTLLVTLQKEQSLVTDDWPWPIQYRSAMGYGCPDTAACDSQYYGFFNQVYNSARQLKRYIMLPNSFNYAVGRNSFVGYNPNGACNGTNIVMQTQATAALYNFTPYQPNGAALNNMYGTGDGCSAYGNRNFWRMFNDWFGATRTDSFTVAIADNGSPSQYLLFGSIKQAIPDPETKIAWGLQNYPIVTMPASHLAGIPNGPHLDRLTRLSTSDSTVFFMDNGKRYRVTSQAMFDSWNLGGRPITNVPPGLFYVPTDGGELKYSVKNANAATIYELDGESGGQTVLRPYQNETVRHAWEGEGANYTEVSSNFFSTIDNAVGATLTHTKVSHAGSEYQVVNGSRLLQPSPYGNLFPGAAQAVSMATLNRLANAGSTTHLIRAAGDNTVYLIDNNTKRAVANPTVLNSWIQPGGRVQLVNASYVALITSGLALNQYAADAGGQTYVMSNNKYPVPAPLDNAYADLTSTATTTSLMNLYPQGGWTLTGFVRGGNSPEVYFLDSSGNKRHIESGDKAALLGANSSNITILPDAMVNSIPSQPSSKDFVSDGTNEYIIEGGTKHLVSAGVKADWGLTSAQVYSDGTLTRFPTGTALASKVKDGNNYFLVKGGRGFLTTDLDIAVAWGITDASQMNSAVVRANMYYYMLTRFVKSTTDSRVFVIDHGNWYNLSGAQQANLGAVNVPMMGLEPTAAPTTITDWNSVVVKSEVNTYYVLDAGGKRWFNHQMIKDQWTDYGALSVPTVTDGFLNLFFNRGPVERTVKGSAPSVYAAWGGTKRHIQYPSTYNQYYAPFGPVSDSLLNVMPTGSNVD